jgi:hypothetical protein
MCDNGEDRANIVFITASTMCLSCWKCYKQDGSAVHYTEASFYPLNTCLTCMQAKPSKTVLASCLVRSQHEPELSLISMSQ